MNVSDVFCPNPACPARGHVGQGTIWIHDRRRGRYRCRGCRCTFRATTGTPLAHKQTPADTLMLVIALVAHGCPIAAIEAAFGLDRRTVRRWLAEAGRHCEQLHHHLSGSRVTWAMSKPMRSASSSTVR